MSFRARPLLVEVRRCSGMLIATTIWCAAPSYAQEAAAASVANATSLATPLERGLDAIHTDKILADLFYVACDDMGGRGTPSIGERLTARFIRNRLQRLGWRPGAREGW